MATPMNTDPMNTETVKYEVWVERGGRKAERTPVYLPFDSKAYAFAARDECALRQQANLFARPEMAGARYFVVEVTVKKEEVTS